VRSVVVPRDFQGRIAADDREVQEMKRRLLLSAEIAVLMVCLLLLNSAFRMLSAPSDFWVGCGVALLLAMFILAPAVILWLRDLLHEPKSKVVRPAKANHKEKQ
jgi:flagellar biosynthesis protein FliP